VHLEDLSISAFINDFRRLISLQFLPRSIISDNEGKFLAMRKYLRKLWANKPIQTMFDKKHIAWNFNTICAPSWLGFWETLVGTTKEVLYKTFGSRKMHFGEERRGLDPSRRYKQNKKKLSARSKPRLWTTLLLLTKSRLKI
jgi:hypothetical protein